MSINGQQNSEQTASNSQHRRCFHPTRHCKIARISAAEGRRSADISLQITAKTASAARL
jgi:hypothetical protein